MRRFSGKTAIMPECFTSGPDADSAAAAARADGFLRRAVGACEQDGRVLGLLQHGSLATGEFDRFSDLDLTCIVTSAPPVEDEERVDLVRTWGDLVAARPVPLPDGGSVLFCLYDPALLRVDVVFRELHQLTAAKEPPVIVWNGSGEPLERQVRSLAIGWPFPDPDELEIGFWLDVEQVLRRLGRGEIFDAIALIEALRSRFLGPMLLRRAGRPPNGLRRIEKIDGAARLLEPTVAGYGRRDCVRALAQCVALYRELRTQAPPEKTLERVEIEVDRRLAELARS
jgi:hypothetical protein